MNEDADARRRRDAGAAIDADLASETTVPDAATSDTSSPDAPAEAGACVGAKHSAGGPDAWGGCWPGPQNTGVPAGTSLSPYTGPCVITTAGTVIDAKTIDCDLVIRAANVTITRSKITGSVASDGASASFAISDTEIDVGQRAGTGVGDSNYTAIRLHVYGGNRSMYCASNCTITDSYVHGQFKDPTGTFHESGMRMEQGSVIRHNTIICDAPDVPPDGGCSADLTGYGDFAPIINDTIERNLFGQTTGGYCTYGGSTAGKPFSSGAHDIHFTDNVYQRGTRKSDHGEYVCGYYGSNTAFDASRPGNLWKGNVYDDGSAVAASN